MLKIKKPEHAPVIVRAERNLIRDIVTSALSGLTFEIPENKNRKAFKFHVGEKTLTSCSLTQKGQELTYKCPKLQLLADYGISIEVNDFEIWMRPRRAKVTMGERTMNGMEDMKDIQFVHEVIERGMQRL